VVEAAEKVRAVKARSYVKKVYKNRGEKIVYKSEVKITDSQATFPRKARTPTCTI